VNASPYQVPSRENAAAVDTTASTTHRRPSSEAIQTSGRMATAVTMSPTAARSTPMAISEMTGTMIVQWVFELVVENATAKATASSIIPIDAEMVNQSATSWPGTVKTMIRPIA